LKLGRLTKELKVGRLKVEGLEEALISSNFQPSNLQPSTQSNLQSVKPERVRQRE
jgi:hypothetical protein